MTANERNPSYFSSENPLRMVEGQVSARKRHGLECHSQIVLKDGGERWANAYDTSKHQRL